MATGSFAVSIYGEPRMTHGIDIVLHLKDTDLDALIALFSEREFYIPPIEVLRIEHQRESHGQSNLIHHATGFKADLYFIQRDPLHLWAIQNTHRVDINDITISLAPPEYVIVRKLEYYREGGSEKHLRDIQSVLACLPDLDQSTIHDFCRDRGLLDQWQQVQ